MNVTGTRGTGWPEVVWAAAPLRGIDARARAEIEAAGRLVATLPGQVLFRAGDPADSLFVVVGGAFSLVALRRGETAPSVIRRAARGDVFGEEATVTSFGARQMDARCDEPGQIAEVPIAVLRRALVRAGATELLSRLERALRRVATFDLLRSAAFTRALPDRDLELLLDAAQHVEVPRGGHVYREGDSSDHGYLVAQGILQAQSDDQGRLRVEAYLARGDLFGDDELEDRSRRRVGVVASGPAWVIAFPRDAFLGVARRQRRSLDGVRRLRVEGMPAPPPPGMQTTRGVFQDLYRMRVARSLLVIDQDSCVRCGHCAWSCASTHDDGISRLIRRGDKIIVQRDDVERDDAAVVARARAAASPRGPALAPLLVPNSCQHCKNPSCMIDCPTGAIGRDARGEVFIREELCTGCGSCAKACPWDNIQIAPRPAAEAKKVGFPDVAVKCDLCSTSAGGPACVAACPTSAIARIDPNAALVELRVPASATRLAGGGGSGLANGGAVGAGGGQLGASALLPRATPAWPWVLGAAVASVGLGAAPPSAWGSGIVAGILFALLVAYAGFKRTPRLLARLRAGGLFARVLYVAHLSLGALGLGAVAWHTHGRAPGNLAGALTLAMALALATGALGALVYALVPRRLSRLERTSALPEELRARGLELDERVFTRLSGKSEVVKTLYAKVLRPYRGSPLGTARLLVTGLSLREEEARVNRRLATLLEGRKSERTDGLPELVRLVVERRATSAARVLTWMLRAWLGVHLAATAVSAVLVVAHLVVVLLGARR